MRAERAPPSAVEVVPQRQPARERHVGPPDHVVVVERPEVVLVLLAGRRVDVVEIGVRLHHDHKVASLDELSRVLGERRVERGGRRMRGGEGGGGKADAVDT